MAMNDINSYIVIDKNTTEDISDCNDLKIIEEILHRNTSNSIIVKHPHNCKEILDNILHKLNLNTYREIINHILNRLTLHKVRSNRNPLYGYLSLVVLNHMMTNSIKIYQKEFNCSENEIIFIRIFRQAVLYYHRRPNKVKPLVSEEHPLIMIYLNKIYHDFAETIFSNTFVYHMKLSTSDRDFHRYQKWGNQWIDYRRNKNSPWDDPIEYRYKFEELTQ